MITYVEAYRADGTQILGNLDGQYAYRGRDYFRTDHYKALRDGKPIKHTRVHHWHVVQAGRVIKIILNNKNYTGKLG